jgi:hypothetical protein
MLTDIRRKIVNAKYVFERASRLQNENSTMALSISLLLMHDASELLMIAVLDHLDAKPSKRRDFMDFWDDVRNAGFPEPKHRLPIDSLNKIRVAFKHSGAIPNPDEVRLLLPRVKGFFADTLNDYCNTTYEEVSLIDLIPDIEVRDLLTKARTKFTDGKKFDAMVDLKVAMHKLQQPEGKYLPRIYAPQAPRMPSEMERTGWKDYFKQLHSFLKQTETVTNALMFGVDPVGYSDFEQTGPILQWSFAGTFTASSNRTFEDVSLERFDELMTFLIDYALKVSDWYIPGKFRRFDSRGNIQMPEA